MNALIRFIPSIAFALLLASAAGAEIVASIGPATTTPASGHWYSSDTRAGGEVSIVSLREASGTLESGQPLPGGVLHLATGMVDADKAEVGLSDSFGLAGEILPSLTLGYDFHKAFVPDGNDAAAPAIKLAFWSEAHAAVEGQDGYVQLVYEPYVNLGHDPAPDAWHRVLIDQHTGRFWSTGGFGQPNSAGGPPYRTLAEWRDSLHADFDGAMLVQVSIGVGSYNQGQDGYVDRVMIGHGAHSALYDFELAPEAPGFAAPGTEIPAIEPGIRGALACVLLIAGLRGRHRS